MIHPQPEQLLAGMADSLEADVLPELPRGAARRELRAAIAILRRLAHEQPRRDAVIGADIADMETVLERIAALTGEPFAPPRGTPKERHLASQAALIDRQARLDPNGQAAAEIDPILRGLFRRMTKRAQDLIPPPGRGKPGSDA